MQLSEIIGNLADHTSDAILIAEAEPVSRPGPVVVWCNHAFTDMTGYLPDEIIGKTPRILQGPDTDEKIRKQISEGLRSWQTVRAQLVNYRKDGQAFWVDLNIKPVADATGWYRYWVAVQRDITAYHEATLRIEEANRLLQRQKAILDNAKDIAIFTDAAGRIEWVNPAFTRKTGYRPEEVLGRKPGELLQGPDTNPATVAHIARALQAGSYVDTEILNYDKAGRPFWADMSIAPVLENGRIRNFVAIQRDITARRQQALDIETLNQKIEYQAHYDALTNLPNRSWINWAFADDTAIRQAALAAINAYCIVDFDDFYLVNDAYGYEAGDEVLRQLADRLVGAAGRDAIVVRLAGDSFALLTTLGSDEAKIMAWGQAIKDSIRKPVHFDGHTITISATLGIARFDPKAEKLTVAEKHAEAALRYAQRAGKRFALYDAEVEQRVTSLRSFAADYSEAFDNKHFVPFFQLQVDSATHRPAGVETLTRWQHPTRGLLNPRDFLPAAEALKVANRIDDLVAETAVSHFERWIEQGNAPPKMSINLRAYRLTDPKYISRLCDLHRRIGCLNIELLETTIQDELHDALLPGLDQLRRVGVGIEIDDFGSGQASILSLIRLKPDRIKIDRKLVPRHHADCQRLEALSTIIILARSVGAHVTAEGIETAAQAQMLTKLGADTLQGYYFARPQPADMALHLSDRPPCGTALASGHR